MHVEVTAKVHSLDICMKKFYCEKIIFVINSCTAEIFNKHCLLTLFSFSSIRKNNFHDFCVLLHKIHVPF